MNNFKKNRFDGGGFKQRGGDRVEMHQATCADCKKPCEVPFRPNGRKPVFCKDCFARNDGQTSSSRDFTPDRYSAPRPKNDDHKSDDVKKQLEILNTKFDRLLTLAEKYFH